MQFISMQKQIISRRKIITQTMNRHISYTWTWTICMDGKCHIKWLRVVWNSRLGYIYKISEKTSLNFMNNSSKIMMKIVIKDISLRSMLGMLGILRSSTSYTVIYCFYLVKWKLKKRARNVSVICTTRKTRSCK